MSSNKRSLVVIMFTDVVGFTSMMQESEQKTLTLIERHRKVLEKHSSAHNGRVVQYYGDGSLSIYPSAVEAVDCAVQIQQDLAQDPRVPLRIGMHIGEILEKKGDIYGWALTWQPELRRKGYRAVY